MLLLLPLLPLQLPGLPGQGAAASRQRPGSLVRSVLFFSVGVFIRAVEGPRGLQADESTDAGEAGWQLTRELWSGLNSRMMEHLEGIKLLQLCEEQRAKGMPVEERQAPTRRGIFAQRKPEPPKTTAPNSVFALAGVLAGKP